MSNDIGTKFEIFVEQLFKDLGKRKVRRDINYKLINRFSKKSIKIIQIDVEFYDWFGKYIVECKYLSNGKVKDDDVNKLKKNLDYLELEKAIIATNQDFHIQAKRLAKKLKHDENKKILLYNREKLQSLDYDRMSLSAALFQRMRGISLENKIRRINRKRYLNKSYSEKRYF